MKYQRLLSPISINGMELKNRSVMQPIHLVYTPDGYCNDKFKEFYYRRAEGGVALCIVGGCRFDDYGAAGAMISLQDDSYIPGFREFTDGMHRRGAKVAVQLYHAGAYAHSAHCLNGRDPVAPSEIFSKFTKEQVREIKKEEIYEIIENWAAAARRAKEAGFDGVEILCSAGYLVCQFLSPVTNHRTDEFGGSWENRIRFPRMVFQAVREAVGADYPLWARIAGNDFVPGSNTNEEAVAFARICEECGLDMINVTGGWHETRVPQLPGDVPRAGFDYLYAAIKEAVSIPVAGSNRINDPRVAEEMLALGQVDLVGGCRTFLADPDFMNKVMAGQTNLIRHCVACNQGCLAKTFFGMPVECLVNGLTGHEFEYTEPEITEGKNILVVGAGPAGCEFAIDAAKLGHRVTIWEKKKEIGGQLRFVAAPPSKAEFLSLKDYYQAMLDHLGVSVVLGKEAGAEEIAAAGFDAVVTATGVVSKTIGLPVEKEGIEICTANEILAEEVIAGKDVVIVGGGSVGCETAQFLAKRGSLSPAQLHFLLSRHAETPEHLQELVDRTDRQVTIVEILKKIGSGFDPGTGWPVLDDLARLHVGMLASSSITAVGADSVTVAGTKKDGSAFTVEIPCDTIVLAVGSSSNDALYQELTQRGIKAYNLGDSQKVGKIIDAIHQARKLAEII